MSNGRSCRVAFSARATSPRSIKVVLQQHQGGTGYGLGHAAAVSTTWTRFTIDFQVSGIAAGNDPDARLTFWLAAGTSTVDLDDVVLTCA